MMQIIYVVMAIGLTVLITFGGISYLNADAPIRNIASRGLFSQYQAVQIAVSSYRAANGGVFPESIAQFSGYLPKGEIPGFGPALDGFIWSMERIDGEERPVLCLKVPFQEDTKFQAAVQFARDVSANKGSVATGETCGSTDTLDLQQTEPAGQNNAYLTIRNF